MDYSIVMPVFNREDLTQNCLATLLPTLEGAGEGEVIVVDNGSRPETAEVLSRYSWVRVIRNETNLGFAVACNQGARAATGQYICHLNNDIVAQPRWLATMMMRNAPEVGIVGARMFYPNDTIQHAGVAIRPVRFGPEGIGPYHIYSGRPRQTPGSDERADFNIVTGACLLTPRDLFLELDGFDEMYWNGYEDVDYCLRVRERGLRVVYEPSAMLYHYESQSGVQRKRRIAHNIQRLGHRWGSIILPDDNRYWLRNGFVRRQFFTEGRETGVLTAAPPTTIIVHGDELDKSKSFLDVLQNNRQKCDDIIWLADGQVPKRFQQLSLVGSALDTVRTLLNGRSDRYFAFVSTGTTLQPGWLDGLINAIEYGWEVVAATVTTVPSESSLEPCAADARCSLLNLRNLPVHVRFGAVDTIDAALVDLTSQAVGLGLGIRSVQLPSVQLAGTRPDRSFFGRFGLEHDEMRRPNVDRLESLCADRPLGETLASIIMLSWNAPEYTKLAVESIHEYTHSHYEIIIVDNGSTPETLAVLRTLPDVRIIYNQTNTGFAHGCNQGIDAAKGTHMVLLNNDVVVTDGWLENLLDAHRRDPLIGVSAPRSNRIVGHQQVGTVSYDSLEGMHTFAAARAREYSGMHYRTNRAIGFCLCIARVVIDEVGGIDSRYGIGNFEDDDFCIRVRAAGYQIAVCEDVFIHHFGSVSFTTNKVDYSSKMQENWKIFASRWDLPAVYPAQGYNPLPAIARGYVRSRDFVGLPGSRKDASRPESLAEPRSYATAFVAVVDSDASWSRVGPIVTNYIKALSADDSTLFAIGVTGESDAATIGARIARTIDRMKLNEERVADIDVSDVELSNLVDWIAAIPAAARLRVAKDDRLADLMFAADRSPSGLLRAVRALPNG